VIQVLVIDASSTLDQRSLLLLFFSVVVLFNNKLVHYKLVVGAHPDAVIMQGK